MSDVGIGPVFSCRNRGFLTRFIVRVFLTTRVRPCVYCAYISHRVVCGRYVYTNQLAQLPVGVFAGLENLAYL